MAGIGESGVCGDCLKWSKKYSKVEGGRNALRETVKILETRLDELIHHNSALKKELEEVRDHPVEDNKVKVALENEIVGLKSEIKSLQESKSSEISDASRQVSCLQLRVSDFEKEVVRLGELVEKEKSRAETALENLQLEKTKVAEALKTAKTEKSRAEKEKTRACAESKKAKEYKIEVDALKTEAVEVRSQLSSAISKFEEANKRLESEVKKALAEKKRADLEKAEAEKQKKFVQLCERNLAEAKNRADTLSCQLDAERKKNEEMLKTVNELLSSKKTDVCTSQMDTNEGTGVLDEKQAVSKDDQAERKRELETVNKKLAEDTSHADHLFLLLEDEKRKNHELKSRIDELTSSKKSLKASDLSDGKSNEIEELKKLLEVEKEKTVKERKRANLLKAEMDFQTRLTHDNEMKFAESMSRANSLSSQLEEEKRRNNELQKKIDMLVASDDLAIGNKAQNDKSTTVEVLPTLVKPEKKKVNKKTKCGDSKTAKLVDERRPIPHERTKALEGKQYGDELNRTLKQCRKRVEKSRSQPKSDLQSESLCFAQVEEVTCVPHHNCRSFDELELKLLREHMKIAQAQLKYSKKEVKFERSRNSILKKELEMLKQEFFHMSNRLAFLDHSLSCNAEGVDDSVKVEYGPSSRMKGHKFLRLKPLQIERECKTSSYAKNKLSNQVVQPSECAMFPPVSGFKLAESTTGNSKLNPPAGNFDEDLFDSPAIDSNRVSFSNCGYVVTQENFGSSTTSSNLSDGISKHLAGSRIFGEVTEIMPNVKPVVVANNGVRSHNNAVSSGECVRDKKRKRIDSLIDSVQYAFSETKKLHIQMEETVSNLHNELRSPVHITNDVTYNNSCDRFDESKRKNVFNTQKASSQRWPNEKLIAEPENSELNGEAVYPGTDIVATVPANDLPNSDPICKASNVDKPTENGHNPRECLNHIINENFMKLLDLDDHEDELRYRRAKNHLLSPSLPDIDFLTVGAFSLDEINHAIKDASVVRVSTSNCGSSDFVHDTWTTPGPLEKEDKTDDSSKANECSKYGFLNMEADVSNLAPCEATSPRKILLKEDVATFCVVFSEIVDCDNLSKIFYATQKGVSQCGSSPSAGVLLKRILIYINQEDLLPKEKVCVFFSTLLNGCHVAMGELNYPIRESTAILSSYMSDFISVINDVETLSCLERTQSLREVLNLIEEFILNGKLWVGLTHDGNPLWAADSSESILLGSMKLTSKAASTDQLLVASSVLASLSLSLNDIDFVRILSYNLFRLHKHKNSVVLAIVHVFAQLLGRKFLTSTSNRLFTSVVESLVLFLESLDSPCSKCPFSEEAVSLDAVLVLLFETLQSLMKKAKTRFCSNGSSEELPNPEFFDVLPDSSLAEIFSQFTDVLSSVELIASYMTWEILSIKVVPQLLLMLESSTLDIFSMTIVGFLGQLGRKGVTANGPQDKGVDRLRCQLTSMLGCNNSRKVMLSVQIAIVSSLSGFLNLDIDSLLHQITDFNSSVTEASSACPIRSWFTSLGKEQQSFSLLMLKDLCS